MQVFAGSYKSRLEELESSTTPTSSPLQACSLRRQGEVSSAAFLIDSCGSFKVHVEVLGSFRGRVCVVLVVGLGR